MLKRIILVFFLWLSSAATACGDPIVLAIARFDGGTFMSTSVGMGAPTHVGFGTWAAPGCNIAVTIGTIGEFDCDGPAVPGLVSLLTDSVNDVLGSKFAVSSSAGGVAALESDLFGGLLTDRQIDHMTLCLTTNNIAFPGLWAHTGYWQIWGTGQPVPEPRSLLVVSCLCFFLIRFRLNAALSSRDR